MKAVFITFALFLSFSAGAVLHQWEQESTLSSSASLPLEVTEFGRSMALLGNELFVAASGQSDGVCESSGSSPDTSGCRRGMLYHYEYNTSNEWELKGSWAPGGRSSNAQFGFSVAARGDWLAVGAPTDTSQAGLIGRVYLYQKQLGVWSHVQTIDAASADSVFGESLHFGESGALYAGAALERSDVGDPGSDRTGAVYVYRLNVGGTSWQQVQRLSEGTVAGRFGLDIEEKSGVLLVAAPDAQSDGTRGAGIVFRYSLVAQVWQLDGQMTAPGSPKQDGRFGFGLYVESANSLYISAQHLQQLNPNAAGVVFHYIHQGGVWQLSQAIEPGGEILGHAFGNKILIADGSLVISASNPGNACNNDCGNILYFYAQEAGKWVFKYRLRPDVEQLARFGQDFFFHQGELLVSAYGTKAGRGEVYSFQAVVGLSPSIAPSIAVPPGASVLFDVGVSNTDGFLAAAGVNALFEVDAVFTPSQVVGAGCVLGVDSKVRCNNLSLAKGAETTAQLSGGISANALPGKYQYSLKLSGGDPAIAESSQLAVGTLLVNSVPVFSHGDRVFNVSESAAQGSVVGEVGATDQDATPLTYVVSGGGSLFEVDQRGRVILSKTGVLDFQRQSKYQLSVVASDGLQSSKPVGVTINVSDVPGSSGGGGSGAISWCYWLLFVVQMLFRRGRLG